MEKSLPFPSSFSLFNNCDEIFSSRNFQKVTWSTVTSWTTIPTRLGWLNTFTPPCPEVKSTSTEVQDQDRKKEKKLREGVMQDLLRTRLSKTDSWAKKWIKQRVTLAGRSTSPSPASLPHAWTLLLFPPRNFFPHLVDSSCRENKGVGTVQQRAARVDPFCSAAWVYRAGSHSPSHWAVSNPPANVSGTKCTVPSVINHGGK